MKRITDLCRTFTRRVAVATLAAALLVAVLLVAVRPSPGHAGLSTAVTIGYDSFIDRFTILEEDTSETVQELYGRIRNNFEHRTGAARLGLFNTFRFGNQTIDDNLDGELLLSPWSDTRIDFRCNVHWKHFQEGSDYSFGNDYMQSNNYLKVRRRITDNLLLQWKNRFEIVDYENRTDFDYDYHYLDTGLEFELGSYLNRFLRLGAAIGFKETPDTTALSYRRTVADIELNLSSGGGTLFHAAVLGDRRDYRETVRSPYWYVLSNAELSMIGIGGTSVSIRFESELTSFDSPTTIYFDTHFIRGGLRLKHPVTATASAFLEPRFARMLCGDFPEERYWEATAILGIDIIGGESFWATLSYEPGYRDYLEEENDLYSNFYLNRISMMGSISLPSNLMLNVFISHDPERHARRDDDFSITLISIDLTKRF